MKRVDLNSPFLSENGKLIGEDAETGVVLTFEVGRLFGSAMVAIYRAVKLTTLTLPTRMCLSGSATAGKS